MIKNKKKTEKKNADQNEIQIKSKQILNYQPVNNTDLSKL